MILLACAALARPVSAGSPLSKFTGPLAEVAAYPSRLPELRARLPALDDDATVRVVVECSGACVVPGEELRWDGLVQARVSAVDLLRVATQTSVTRIRLPWTASSKVTSEGVATVMDVDWNDAGISGAGVTVAVVDVGFAGCDELAGTELPADYDELFDYGAPEGSAHGCAVAEVIQDFAPEAHLRLASFGTDVELGSVLQTLLDEGVDVVNASIGFDNVWHADGTSPVTRYADAVVEAGVVYVAAGGNEADNYRVGELSPSSDGQYVQVAGHYAILVRAPGGTARVSFRWSEPFGEAATDLDLVLFNADDGRECGRSENPQDGDDHPFEEVYASGCEDWVYATVFSADGQAVDGLTGFVYSAYGLDDLELTSTQSLTLPADCFDCVAVGAVVGREVAAYSSRGPSDDGRTKPDVVAPSDVSTATLGSEGFAGSSAAAPHAAGLLALWVDATERRGEPREARQWLLDGATDLGAAGADNDYGAGLVTAGEVPPEDCGCGATGVPGPAVVLAASWILVRPRTRRCWS